MWSAADIVNTVLASVGIAIAIGGLAIVVWQIRKATGAAEAARDATSKTMQALAQRFTTADLDLVRTALRTILDNLQGEDRQSVWSGCQDTRERLIELRARPGLENQQGQLTPAITSVSEAQKALDDGVGEVDWGDVRKNVSDALDSVVELQQHALFFKEEGASREQRP